MEDPGQQFRMRVAAPELSVVIVTHESARDITDCLASVQRDRSAPPHEIIVVDNASRDTTVDLVEANFGEVHLVRSTRRRGFSANCNAGASVARGRILFFLNPDARLTPGVMEALTLFLDSRRDVGLVGPRLVYPDGSWQPSARRFPKTSTTLIRRTPLRWISQETSAERDHLMLDCVFDRAQSVDWLLGAAIAMPAHLYRELGGMDERYRLYCEDIDLSWRIWEAGYKVAYLPTVVVEHRLSELTRKRFLTRATIWHGRSMARFVVRHGLRPPEGSLSSQTARGAASSA